MKQLLLDVLVLLLVAAAGALAAGWAVSHMDSQALSAARGNLQTCKASNKAAEKVQDQLRTDRKAEQAAVARMRKQAAAAEKANQALKHRLRQRAQADHQAIEESPHAHPDCRALAHLGICPSVSRRLWPQAGHGAAAAH